MATELDFCSHLMQTYDDFWHSDKADYLGPFRQPVNEVADNAPGYYRIITDPMDLDTMRNNLSNGLYANAAAFKADFDKIIENCRIYNKDSRALVRQYADRLKSDFDWEWTRMRDWMTKERRKARLAATAPALTATTAPTTTAPAPTTAAPAPTAAPIAAIAPAAAPSNVSSASTYGAERYVI